MQVTASSVDVLASLRQKSLPPNWALTNLDELAEINPRDGKVRDIADHFEVSFVPMAAVDAEQGTIAGAVVRTLGEVRRGFTPFRNGDVIWAKITPCMENGKAAVANDLANGLGFGSTEFHVLRPQQGVLPEWIFHFVRQARFREDAKIRFSGAVGQQRVPTAFLETYQIPLPPTAEQRRIVAEIEKQISRLDAAVAALKRVQANLRRYRASVLKAACEGRLVPQDPNDEPASELLKRILAERRAGWEAEQLRIMTAAGETPKDDSWKRKYEEPQGPTECPPSELPANWCWSTAEQLGAIRLGRQRSPKNRSKDYPTKYLRAANITEDGLNLSDILEMDFSPREQSTYHLLPGDLLLSEASGSSDQVGKPAVWNGELQDCCFQNTVIRLRPVGVGSRYLLTFFQYCYSSGIFAAVATGVGINHLSASRFSRLAIPLAPSRQQARIVNEVESRLSVIQELLSIAEKNLKRADRLRQSILKRAFEGKLVPQAQNDEPASVLLERIRAERGLAPAKNGGRGQPKQLGLKLDGDYPSPVLSPARGEEPG